eukprot:TRINITY_DN19488_c0_g1_i1.p1 TRINITY_DN19488_c0_g1~~TRINITY_DN19488_c0_g1_i1.p1  ORF type:complete len:477 (+),score=200.65 TRINITY_DN19488_c0_g1_i1:22-1431(+)
MVEACTPQRPQALSQSPPLSPRQPWGHRAIQKTHFSWKSAFGDFAFDTTDEGCEPFGVYHNDRVLISKGVWCGKKATVLGVSNGVMWVHLDDEEYVKDLKGCFDGAELEKKYGLQLLEEEEAEDEWPLSPEHPKLQFIGAKDEEDLKQFEYEGPMGMYTFNCTREVTEEYGFHHGQRVRATKGAYRSRCATVIGVHNGALWIHLDGDRGASPCHFCNTKDDLEKKYGWKVLNTPISVGGGITAPYDKVEYMGPFGHTYAFERGEEAMKQYDLRHGQTLQIGRGISQGKKAVVIGVLTGVLWWHIQGDRAATPCSYCNDMASLRERYDVTVLHDALMIVEPNTNVWPNYVIDSEQRAMDQEEIEAVSLEDEQWDESQQPQTYRYLRAYARWRLPKNTPPGQAFMLYYVKDTAPRTAEALDNLRTLRKYWAMQQNQGKTGYAKSFQHATEKEMVHCLRQIPLSAMKIIAAA